MNKLRILQLIVWDSFICNILPFLLLWPLGLILLPFLIPFRKVGEVENTVPQTGWKALVPPFKWAKVWMGEHGWMGDGTWTHNCPAWAKGKKGTDSFLAIYLWSAFRNPVGGWDRIAGFTLKSTDKIEWWGSEKVSDTNGDAGWQFVVTHGSRTVTGFYWIKPLWKGKCLRIRIGYKVKPSYKGINREIDATPISISIKNFGSKK